MVLDRIAEAFGIDPDRAAALDYERAVRVLESRAARQAHEAFAEKRTMTGPQTDFYGVLHDALDRRDEEAGIPPEP